MQVPFSLNKVGRGGEERGARGARVFRTGVALVRLDDECVWILRQEPHEGKNSAMVEHLRVRAGEVQLTRQSREAILFRTGVDHLGHFARQGLVVLDVDRFPLEVVIMLAAVVAEADNVTRNFSSLARNNL